MGAPFTAGEYTHANGSNVDINIGYEGTPVVANGGGGASSSSLKKGIKPKFPGSTFVNKDTRYYPSKDPPPPAPGSYDVQPKWETKGVIPMSVSKTRSIKRSDGSAEEAVSPGPGDYNISLSYVKKLKNRKNILLTTSDRFSLPTTAMEPRPNPTTYNPYPIQGSLLKSTHNVLLVS